MAAALTLLASCVGDTSPEVGVVPAAAPVVDALPIALGDGVAAPTGAGSTGAATPTPRDNVLRVCPPVADGTCFVHVGADTFIQGAQARDSKAPNYDPRASAEEGPPHRVQLPEFWILSTEATRGMVMACVEDGACPESMRRVNKVATNLPANGLNWTEASKVCASVGGRLPTEAEWEYAARGAGWQRWPWGDLPVCPFNSDAELQSQSESRAKRVGRCGEGVERAAPTMTPGEYNLTGIAVDFWTDTEFDAVCASLKGLPPRAAADAILSAANEVLARASAKDLLPTCTISEVTYSVEGKKSVPFGLTGMAANVAEWTLDGFDKKFYADAPAVSPVGKPSVDGRRVVRGGSFTALDASEWRTTARASLPEDVQLDDVGFRCVREKAP